MDEKIYLTIPVYAASFYLPAFALVFLLTRSFLGDRQKQVVAIPFLVANLLYPLLFSTDNRCKQLSLSLDPRVIKHSFFFGCGLDLMIFCCLFNFTIHLQLIDLVYTGRSVPSIPHHIWTAAWSGLRNAKQPAEKDKVGNIQMSEFFYWNPACSTFFI
jgi:hypothetical protein